MVPTWHVENGLICECLLLDLHRALCDHRKLLLDFNSPLERALQRILRSVVSRRYCQGVFELQHHKMSSLRLPAQSLRVYIQ